MPDLPAATFAVVNIVSTRWGTRVQSVFSVAKVMALAVIIIVGVIQMALGQCTAMSLGCGLGRVRVGVGVCYNASS